MAGKTLSLDEKQLALFVDQYYVKLDMVYRFAALLSLSFVGAERITELTFRTLLERFSSLKSEANSRAALIGLCWNSYLSVRQETFPPATGSAVMQLKSLSVEQRAILMLTDDLSLDPKAVAQIFSIDETRVRRLLAQARQRLVQDGLNLD
jgi:hypothetical protein